MRKNLTKEERLKGKKDIRGLFKAHKTAKCPGLTLLYTKNNLPFNRILTAPSGMFRTAAARNKVKRQFRELYRTNKHIQKRGYDLGFVIYPGRYDYRQREKQMRKVLEQSGLIKKGE
jgi:ribonuclease P protein component